MRLLLIITLAIIYLSQVNCLNLTSLCPNSTILYKGQEINSYLQIRRNVTLERVGCFTISGFDLTNDNSWFQDDKVLEEFQRLVESYNDYIFGIYSEEYMNSEKVKDILLVKNKVLEFESQVKQLAEKAFKDKKQYIFDISKTISMNINELVDSILIFTDNILHPEIWSLNKFKSYLDLLEINPQTETSSFKDDPIEKIYKQSIKLFNKFYFKRTSDVYYDVASYAVVEIAVFLPFNSKQYEEGQCDEEQSLPPFFFQKEN